MLIWGENSSMTFKASRKKPMPINSKINMAIQNTHLNNNSSVIFAKVKFFTY